MLILQRLLLPIFVGLVWGITNPYIARGVRTVAQRPARRYSGFEAVDSIVAHLLTPAFIVPQYLNLCASVLFMTTVLASTSISVAGPVANGVSLASGAVFDHLLGDNLQKPWSGAVGLVLVAAGSALCTAANAEQHR